MKKILLSILTATAALASHAQGITNGSFESWGPSTNPFLLNAEDPISWQVGNVGNIVHIITGSQTGASHLRLSEGNFFGQIIPGIMFNYYATNQRFAYLNGYFRKPQGTDTLTVALSYSTAGGTFDTADAVSGGAQRTNRTAAAWTPFHIAFYVPRPNVTVDSGRVILYVAGAGTGYEIDGLVESNTP